MKMVPANNKVVITISRRDDLLIEEAREVVQEFLDDLDIENEDPSDTIMDVLGLEPDYLEYLWPYMV